MRNQTIRIKIVLAFMTVVIFGSIILLIQSFYNQKESRTTQFVNHLERYKSYILTDAIIQQEFFNIDLISDQYFLSTNSSRLNDHDLWQKKMKETIQDITLLDPEYKLISVQNIENLEIQRERYNTAFLELVATTTALGFKDYGKTGEMRKYAHLLEDSFSSTIPLAKILMLRRHEKDFIIRKEDKYYEQFISLTNEIRKDILNSENNSNQAMVLQVIDQYAEAFQSVYQYHKLNGLNTHSGLKAMLTTEQHDLLRLCNEIIFTTELKAKSALAQINRYFWISVVLYLLFIGILVDYLARLLSRPIKLLSAHTDSFVASGFTASIKVDRFEGRRDEIGLLYANFTKLAEEITVHFKNYRQSAERKHQEITLKNQEIESQRLMLVNHRNLLSARNKSVTDSIAYAKRLQKAIFPPDSILREKLGNHTLFFKPKDIVSGDFYWVEETEEALYFAVADCTGHGVPGAFMSLIGNNFLNQAILEMDLSETGEILDYLNTSISALLNQSNEETEIRDGMDIALCRWIKSKNILQFSGANRPLVVVRNNETITHKPNRLPIGWQLEGSQAKFTTQEIKLEKDDLLCLFSDGYYDQFGGNNDKKYKFSRFKDLMKDLHPEDFKENYTIIEREHNSWKGKSEQVDDLCILVLGANHLLDNAPHYTLNKPQKMVSLQKDSFANGNRFKVVG